MAEFGADHILVRTDYPADMGEIDPVGFIEGAPGLDDATRRAILGGTWRGSGIELPGDSDETLERLRRAGGMPVRSWRRPGSVIVFDLELPFAGDKPA